MDIESCKVMSRVTWSSAIIDGDEAFEGGWIVYDDWDVPDDSQPSAVMKLFTRQNWTRWCLVKLEWRLVTSDDDVVWWHWVKLEWRLVTCDDDVVWWHKVKSEWRLGTCDDDVCSMTLSHVEITRRHVWRWRILMTKSQVRMTLRHV